MDRFRALINDDINLIENKLSDVIKTNTFIHKDLGEFINGTSKRIRSILCILYLKANNAIISDKVIDILTSAELIHNASLLHDDVIDDSEQRRGEESFNKKFNSKVSILSGDYLLSIAVKYLLKTNNTDILNIFLNTTENMSNAELKQYSNRNKIISLQDYIDIINGKTASLFKAILESAAILTNLDRSTAGYLGEQFGLLFQINNDTQKGSIINDKKNGTCTIIDILGIEKTQGFKDNYKEKMREIIKIFPNNKYSKGLEDLTKTL